MRSLPTCHSPFSWRVLPAVLLCAAAGDTHPPAPPSVRPVMSVTVKVEGPRYSLKLGPKQAELEKLFGDSVRAVLNRNFGFLQWADSGPNPYTLTLKVVQNNLIANLALKLSGDGMARTLEPQPRMFETLETLTTRQDWEPKNIVTTWGPQFEKILLTSREEMISTVFSQVPLALAAPIDRIKVFLAPNLGVQIKIGPDELQAAARGEQKFRLELKVEDPGPPSSNTNAFVDLVGCVDSNDGPGYACEMGTLNYRGFTGPAADRSAVLARSRLTPVALYVLQYQQARFQTGAGGLVPPS